MPLDAFTNTFAGNPLDRASHRRTDAAWLAERLADSTSLAIPLWNGKPLIENGTSGAPQLAYVAATMGQELAGGPERLLFMGLWRETAVFAVDVDSADDPTSGPLEGLGRFEDLRTIAPSLSGPDAAIAATAKAVFEWRRRHRHCAVCGQASEVAEAGWKRICPSCGGEHFPRTDPVVIMLPVRGERCLLGRQAAWPKGMFSALAGFLEPGETVEEACAREVFEEAHLIARRVRYHSTQPWPYPSSLMIGLIAEVEDGEAEADRTELDEVRWFSREDAQALVRGEHSTARAPGALAIAHQLIKAWAFEEG
ncbi:MAG TPA: NAD(+) diphosphatase [Caulobacteraceae bacterium]|jgi:NAD+ diphosphatase|nr:NAD(+) diphosphatase [Caulobacteraceae bacterium]